MFYILFVVVICFPKFTTLYTSNGHILLYAILPQSWWYNYSLSNNIKLQKQFNPIFAFKHICIEKTEKASTIGWIMDNCDVFSPTAHLFCIHLKVYYVIMYFWVIPKTGPNKLWKSTTTHEYLITAKLWFMITGLKLFQETIKMYNAKAFRSQLLF